MAANVFTLTWSGLRGYANPTWNLVGRVLAQAQQHKADLIPVTPVWRAQSWYQTILQWTCAQITNASFNEERREKSSKTYESHFQKW